MNSGVRFFIAKERVPLARDTSATAMTKDQTKKRAKNRAVSESVDITMLETVSDFPLSKI